jgi:hypothetical protein
MGFNPGLLMRQPPTCSIPTPITWHPELTECLNVAGPHDRAKLQAKSQSKSAKMYHGTDPCWVCCFTVRSPTTGGPRKMVPPRGRAQVAADPLRNLSRLLLHFKLKAAALAAHGSSKAAQDCKRAGDAFISAVAAAEAGAPALQLVLCQVRVTAFAGPSGVCRHAWF